MTEFQLAVIGDWHLAFCTAVSFSKGEVRTVLKLRRGSELQPGLPPCPIVEPGFEELNELGSNRELLFHTGDWTGWRAPVWWLAADTPVDDQDRPNTQVLFEILDEGFTTGERPEILAVSSQVPLGFCRELNQRYGTPVVYIPENLRLGQGIETFFRADRTVIGADEPAYGDRIQALMGRFETQFYRTNLATAEMVKHATNTFLAMSISFANEVARIGEKFGVDHGFVAEALKADKRIGPLAYVKPGLGFAGGTLPRDLRVIQKLGQQLDVPTPLVNAVLMVNENVDDVIVSKILDLNLSPRKVLLAGYSYKPDVDTVRRSPAERLARRLKAHDFEVYGFDPVMNGKPLEGLTECLQHCASLREVPHDCRLYVIVTARPQFKDLKWNENGSMAKVVNLQSDLWGTTWN